MRNGLFLLAAGFACSVLAGTATVKMAPGENWWGAANFFGAKMPFTEKTDLEIDLRRNNYHNQCASFLLSDRGRVVWADAQAKFTLRNGEIAVEAASDIVVEQGGA